MKLKIIIIAIATYLILLWDCKIKFSNKKYVWEFKYKGLLWVGLDYWSIWKYESTDVPMKWIEFKTYPYSC